MSPSAFSASPSSGVSCTHRPMAIGVYFWSAFSRPGCAEPRAPEGVGGHRSWCDTLVGGRQSAAVDARRRQRPTQTYITRQRRRSLWEVATAPSQHRSKRLRIGARQTLMDAVRPPFLIATACVLPLLWLAVLLPLGLLVRILTASTLPRFALDAELGVPPSDDGDGRSGGHPAGASRLSGRQPCRQPSRRRVRPRSGVDGGRTELAYVGEVAGVSARA